MHTQHVMFIGGGRLASALIGGLLKEGLDPAQLSVCDPDPKARAALQQHFALSTYAVPEDAAARPMNVVVLAVKPQVLATVLSEWAPLLQPSTLVISTVAGARLQDLSEGLAGHRALVRSMPNTPALIGQGMTGLVAGPSVSADEKALATQLLGSVGEVLWLDREADLDVVTALSGSGPAYFFALAEHLIAAGCAAGLSAADCQKLVCQTAAGAGLMLINSDLDASALRAQVTSPGGTTEAALQALQQGHFAALIEQAVSAATARAQALSQPSTLTQPSG